MHATTNIKKSFFRKIDFIKLKPENALKDVVAGIEGERKLQSEDSESEIDASNLIEHKSANLLNNSLPLIAKDEPVALGKRP